MSDGDHECGKKVFTEVKSESSFPVDFYIVGRFRVFFLPPPPQRLSPGGHLKECRLKVLPCFILFMVLSESRLVK